MDRRRHKTIVLILIAMTASSGCQPTQPFFLNEDGDLSHLLDEATQLEYPDVDSDPLPDASQTQEPMSLTNSDPGEPWDLSLEEVISIALQNSKMFRTINPRAHIQVGQSVAGPPENLSNTSQPTDFLGSIYDPAIVESGQQGVEAALAAFDTQWNTNVFWDKTDRPQNVDDDSDPAVIFARVLNRDNTNFQSELTKRSVTGTQWSFRNVTTYDASNRPLRVLSSEWLTSFEAEARHPLLRGGGTQVNRIPIMLARAATDRSLVTFEVNVRNFLLSIERGYWDLYFFYRNLEASKVGRDVALLTWKRVNALYETSAQGGTGEQEAQAREQYFFFRGRTEEAKRDILIAERNLRFLMGIAATDGRIIRPSDEPTIARVEFEWSDILAESLVTSGEIRFQKWNVKSRELELIGARNNLLPQFDLVALYRWVGLGDDLASSSRNGLNFPNPGSTAFDDLTEGRFQEWRLGIDVQVPLGFRAEHAAVRSQQLRLARAKARLEDMELEISHSLTDAVQRLQADYALTQTAFLQREAAIRQVRVLQNKLDAGTVTLDFLLDAQRRAADAQVAFYRSLSQYNVSIAEVHSRKGSLFEYCGVMLQEGPWPAKAYFDALIRARQRDASYYFDYGYSRPKVISRGPVSSHLSPSLQGRQRQLDEEVVPEGVPTPADVDDLPSPATPQPVEPANDTEPRSALKFAGSGAASADPSSNASQGPVLTPASGPDGEMRNAQKFEWDGIFAE